MHHESSRSTEGFTLLETLIATSILVTALAGIAQLFIVSIRFTRDADARGIALSAAQAKLEILRSLTLGYEPTGAAVTDPALVASPPSSLREDTTGYADALDVDGRIVAGDFGAGVMFIRRWAVTPIDLVEPQAVVIEVCVFRLPAEGVPPAAAEACLSTVRTRQP